MEKISDICWKYLEAFTKYLKYCYDFTVKVQADNETLTIAYLALKILIYDSLQTYANEFTIITDIVEDLKNSYIQQFEMCFKNEDILLCCILDTRTKDFLESNRKIFSEKEYEHAKLILKKK